MQVLQDFLTTREVARLFNVRESTLCERRKRGQGPPWLKWNGRYLYRRSEVEKLLAESQGPRPGSKTGGAAWHKKGLRREPEASNQAAGFLL